jgi:ribosome maturation factor RimP
MVYTERADDPMFDLVRPVVEGLGLALVELSVSRHKGSVQARIVVFKAGGIGVKDCSAVHRAVQARLEVAFAEADVYIEVSSPGIDRTLKAAGEFQLYVGLCVRCYLYESSAWVGGVLESADKERIVLSGKDGRLVLEYGRIAKAKLDGAGSPQTGG